MTDDATKKKGGWHRLAFTLLIVPVFWYGSGFVARWIQPWRYADEPQCVRYDDGAYANVCEFPVVVRWCLDANDTEPDSAGCHQAELAPGESDRGWSELLAHKERGAELWRYTCKAPFVPGRVSDLVKPQRTIDGCKRPPEAASG